MKFTNEVIDKLKGWAVYAFIFFVPVFYIIDSPENRADQEKFFQVAAMGLGSLFFGNIWITLFVWLNLVLHAVGGWTVGGTQVLSVFLFGVLFASSRNFFRDKEVLKYLGPLKLIALLSLVAMVMQLFGVDLISVGQSSDGKTLFDQTYNRPTGLMRLDAINGIFFGMIAALFFFTTPLIGLLCAIPVFNSHSSAAFMAYAALLLFWGYYKLKKRLFLILLAVASVGFVAGTYLDYKDDPLTYKSRFESWHLYTRTALSRPIGFGPDSFRKENNVKNFTFQSDEDYNPGVLFTDGPETKRFVYYSANLGNRIERFRGRIPKHFCHWQEAHNDYIQFFFEYGILGLILLFFFFKEIKDRFVLSEKTSELMALSGMILVLAVCSITQFPFHLARITGIFGIIVGAFWAVTDKSYYRFKEV